jgi:protein gp37
MGTTKIEWTEKTWNPITGCSPVSEGCQNCYARRMAYRLRGRYDYPKDEPFKITFHPERLNEPIRWKKPSRIFICSMGDLFHETVKYTWIESIMETVIMQPQHIFLFLTKRPQRMKDVLESWKLRSKENLWLGVSVENQKTADERIPILLQIPAVKRFVSVEPMLEEIEISEYLPQYKYAYDDPLINQTCYRDKPIQSAGAYKIKIEDGLDWIICGGETGPKARPMYHDWVVSLRDQCQAAGVPFFFKKWGNWFLKTQQSNFIDRQIDGKKWEEYPIQN